MIDLRLKSAALALLAACAGGAVAAETAIRFDSSAPRDKPAVSLFDSIREATKDAEVPAVAGKPAAAKAALLPAGAKAAPAWWGWGRGRSPYDPPYGGPYRGPYYDPYRGPYRDPYYDPYRGPYYPGPWAPGPWAPGPGQGPTREPWRDPPTRGGGWR